MNIVIVSDTHGQHEQLPALKGDVLIHCGDMFSEEFDADEEFERLDDWFGRQDFGLILCTGGNHDFELEKRAKYVDQPFKSAVFLAGASYKYHEVNFYGAPWVPDLRGQAFYRNNDDLEKIWLEIPGNVDVLITHTPPAGILDVSSGGYSLGCPYLVAAIETCQPKVHCFGHVHASSGELDSDGIKFINAASINSRTRLIRPPREFVL